jgi:hypothetical protein
MNITQQGAVTIIRPEIIRAGWEQWVLLQSDQHIDSIFCNRELLIAHLDEAKRRDAWIISVGDLFDAMQGRFDPRRSMDELRPEYRRENYYDFVVQDVTRILYEYRDCFAVIADGNHELSVLKNANTNLADRLVSNLRQAGASVVHGGYGGWVVLQLKTGPDGPYHTIKIRYFHGSGGEAPVTRGAIQTARQAVYLPDADVVVNGHSHNAYTIPISRERITDRGYHYQDIAWYLRTPGYKQSYGDGTGGWEVTRGGVPKPIGAIWLKLHFDASNNVTGKNHNGRVVVTAHEDLAAAEMISPCGEVYQGVEYAQDAEGV